MAELTITKNNFNVEVAEESQPVLLDFWAEWCGPCKMLSPVIAEIARKYEGKLKVGKVNVDEERELADQFSVVSIPMLVLMKNGKVVSTLVGYRPMDAVEDWLRKTAM